MAELVFFTGPMDCGKSTLALQMDYTQSAHDRQGELFTCHDRSGHAVITSRIGLSSAATEVGEQFDFFDHVVAGLTSGRRIDYVICDEAQFYSPDQIDQLARVCDELDIDVLCFGILADFRTELFPGSRRLVELADRMETLQVRPLCWCGARATHNARTLDGVMVTEGSQVVVGDTAGTQPAHVVQYEVLCRKHHRLKMSKHVAMATLSPEVLPFEEDA
ncbi:thymidine kinase [Aestuariimicrobium sp. T2.26MG-19.2B]|uniref:thymidine kinase n=1 Tax=Aestuariimicrobium sp. T2.26MG-19.2B TaxID=3040679 RepID=UPI00247730C8|nr:thymidine kinase [Aestuariimicrobium sp. T2.26MG-19.2B]CAI9408715.1 Thymidine kinase [Aestuariimicrobium sp. T2.26MG-19.2B]